MEILTSSQGWVKKGKEGNVSGYLEKYGVSERWNKFAISWMQFESRNLRDVPDTVSSGERGEMNKWYIWTRSQFSPTFPVAWEEHWSGPYSSHGSRVSCENELGDWADVHLKGPLGQKKVADRDMHYSDARGPWEGSWWLASPAHSVGDHCVPSQSQLHRAWTVWDNESKRNAALPATSVWMIIGTDFSFPDLYPLQKTV